ncbi:MAG: hypothetical protein WBO48_16435, partial [Candidatus Promineifilaceae bacterium]
SVGCWGKMVWCSETAEGRKVSMFFAPFIISDKEESLILIGFETPAISARIFVLKNQLLQKDAQWIENHSRS